MTLQLGEIAPDFTVESTEGTLGFHQWLGKDWAVLFSHPADYTPVCTTELGAFARRKDEFAARGVKLVGVSVDPLASHHGWARDIEQTQGAALNYPLLADADQVVATLYGMIHPKADPKVTVRTVFIIDSDKKIRLTLTYPPSTGRNVDEILRVIDSLQLTDKHKVATPVDWQNGEDVIIVPSLSDDDAKQRFPDGWEAKTPYLRVVRQPD
ncbi:peroxiredoxin [Halomonas sp. LBP4]|uniref:peroxiredoxin n=1 Tax=Halomonas sp. LBP4 TaxID=2044917 RepID=UPI000D75264C|nr:peroxiredoxin [Halomonas sp. LBP4]PXX95791.1 peroxiredoxin [Halomonas sp. LBP4]